MRFICVFFAFASVIFAEIFPHKPSVVEVKEELGPGGLWQTKVQWKAHWVKHWETRKIWIPIWRKIWGPVQVREWLPLPKVPPTWKPHTTWTVPSH